MENSIIKAIETRRSVRSFSQKAIPEELLDAVLKAGTYAPTGQVTQGKQNKAIRNGKNGSSHELPFFCANHFSLNR